MSIFGADTMIVQALSAAVVQILDADQGSEFAVPVAPLSDGRILLGREFLKNRTSPSRVVMIPLRSEIRPPDTKSNAFTTNGIQQGRINRILRRPLATDRALYQVHCWGQSNPADQERDFDATRYLAHVVMQAGSLIAMGSIVIGGGEWSDQQEHANMLLKAGHEFVFTMALDIPVTDSAVQLPPKPLTVQQPVNVTVT